MPRGALCYSFIPPTPNTTGVRIDYRRGLTDLRSSGQLWSNMEFIVVLARMDKMIVLV